MDKKEVELKVRTKSKEFYLTIFQKIKEGKNPSQISKELNLPIQNLNPYIKKLKEEGFISKKSYGVWEVKKELKVSSLGTRPITNLHALQINFPIISGKIDDSDWQVKEKLNHWLPKYRQLDVLGGLQIKNNNNKTITIFAKSRNISTLEEIDSLAFKIRNFAYDYFRLKYNVILDKNNAQVKNLNLATEDKNSESMIRKGEKFELDLNKKAEKIFPKDNIDAKAWIDGSPFTFSSETNDKEWKRAYLQMPFTMQNTMTAVHYIAQNYASHVKMVEEGTKVISKMNKLFGQPEFKAVLKKRIDKYQRRLSDFI